MDSDQSQSRLNRSSAWTLIAVNLIPLAGVLVWDWAVFDVVLLYWIENVIIGFINVLRMALCNPDNPVESMLTAMMRNRYPGKRTLQPRQLSAIALPAKAFKFFLVPFFVIHYGMFCFGHGTFVFLLFGRENSGGGTLLQAIPFEWPMLIAIASLAASHLYSFVQNYIRGGEYRKTNLFSLMMRPYGRIVVMHIAIITGGALIIFLNTPLAFLLVLIVMKTGLDLRYHLLERDKLAGSPAEKTTLSG